MKGIENNKWHLLTGERSDIYNLGRNQYFVEEDLGLEKNLVDFGLVDDKRQIREIYNELN